MRVKEAAITIAKRLELAFAKAGQDEDLLWVLEGLIEREGRFSSLCGSTKEVSLGNLGTLSWDGLHCDILSDGSVLVRDFRSEPSEQGGDAGRTGAGTQFRAEDRWSTVGKCGQDKLRLSPRRYAWGECLAGISERALAACRRLN